LPSSLTSVLSITLGYSPHPPESVYGTITYCLKLRGFSWKHGINDFVSIRSRHHVSELTGKRICLPSPPTRLNRKSNNRLAYPSPSPHRNNRWYRNINLFPINYAFRPRLRDRLTLRRLPLRRKPWVYGVQVSHPHFRYSCQHNLL
jgi:hypothetical protein